MPLETATYISDLVVTNPANSDGLNQADDHMRLIKAAVKATFPGITGAISSATGSGIINSTVGAALFNAYAFNAEPGLGFYRSSSSVIAYTGTLLGAVPIGGLLPFGGAAAPTGYLACDGQAVSRTTYAQLFAAIGTTWGAGDGSTTFNVPPLNDRFLRHRTVAGAAGAVGTLQASQNLTHTHTGTGTTGNNSADHTHTYSGTTGAMNANASHTHGVAGGNIYAGSSIGGVTGGGGFNSALTPGVITIGTTNTDHGHTFSGTTSGISANHTHAFSFTSAGGSADGTEARPLSASVLFCIRAL